MVTSFRLVQNIWMINKKFRYKGKISNRSIQTVNLTLDFKVKVISFLNIQRPLNDQISSSMLKLKFQPGQFSHVQGNPTKCVSIEANLKLKVRVTQVSKCI